MIPKQKFFAIYSVIVNRPLNSFFKIQLKLYLII